MARVSILISKTGAYVNPEQSLIQYSAIDGSSVETNFFNQVTLEFYTAIKELSTGVFEPDNATVVNSGLSGTVEFGVWSSENSPYPVPITEPTIDVSEFCMLQWTGITQKLDITCTGITGANYINVLLDRK